MLPYSDSIAPSFAIATFSTLVIQYSLSRDGTEPAWFLLRLLLSTESCKKLQLLVGVGIQEKIKKINCTCDPKEHNKINS